MVLIHGLAMDLTFWDHQVAPLAAHFEVIRYDARGHGASEQADPPYSLELMADDLDHFYAFDRESEPHTWWGSRWAG